VTLTLPASAAALLRREQLLKAHPNMRISAGTGFWQAEIDEPSGMTIITRYELGKLIDRVQVVLAATAALRPPSRSPAPPHEAVGAGAAAAVTSSAR
jgi:hypothetical protein